MGDRLVKIASSFTTTLVLLSIYGIALAAATIVEKYEGTMVAKDLFYYAPAMFLLQFFLVVNFVAIVIRRQYKFSKRLGMVTIHAAFIIILLGAFVSHLFGIDGVVHLREGESTDTMSIQAGDTYYTHRLPFSVELTDFRLVRYPGSSSPSSYENDLIIVQNGVASEKKVFMNNVMDVEGYRFFQASYDSDEQGTILSVNKDVCGRNITYTGYFLLLLGFLASFFERNSRFRTLLRLLNSFGNKATIVLLLFALINSKANAQASSDEMSDFLKTHIVDADHAAQFGLLPMQSRNGRMLPINTFSSELLRKVAKQKQLGDISSDQFLISFWAMPEKWLHLPFIEVPNQEIVSLFDLEGEQTSYVSFFTAQGEYKLGEAVNKAYEKMANERTKFDKDLLKVDERVNVIYQLNNRQLVHIFPNESDLNHHWSAPGDDLSSFQGADSAFVASIIDEYLKEVRSSMKSGDWSRPNEILSEISRFQQSRESTLDISAEKMGKEVSYNRYNVFSMARMGYLISGGLLLLILLIALFFESGFLVWIRRILIAAIVFTFIYHAYGMGLRWYIAGYAPWSNSYETMVYVSWASVLGGLLFGKKSPMTLALATLFGGVILFVSGLSWMDPQISPLVPVLKSPWLMFHVAVIVAAYGFFGICALLGLMNLVIMSVDKKANSSLLKSRIKELSTVNEISMLLGLALMTIGTFLGAIWANESWGRYWGWDPKETWALITMVVYAIVTHLRLVPKCKSVWLFNLMSVVAIASVLMTFFGVNYFLSGMHSYGMSGNIGGTSIIYILGAIVVVFILAILSHQKNREE